MNLEQVRTFFGASFKEKKPAKSRRKGKRNSKKGQPPEDEDEDECQEDEFLEVPIPEPTVPPPKKFNRAPSFLLPHECISPLKECAFASDDDDEDEEDEGPPRKVARISVGERPGTSGCSGMSR